MQCTACPWLLFSVFRWKGAPFGAVRNIMIENCWGYLHAVWGYCWYPLALLRGSGIRKLIKRKWAWKNELGRDLGKEFWKN